MPFPENSGQRMSVEGQHKWHDGVFVLPVPSFWPAFSGEPDPSFNKILFAMAEPRLCLCLLSVRLFARAAGKHGDGVDLF